MADLRLYAIGIDEVRRMYGADDDSEPVFRDILATAFAPPAPPKAPGLLGRIGPLFKRDPYAPVVNPSNPTPEDVDAFLDGESIDPDRVPAAWRILETLVHGRAWGSIRLPMTPQQVDDVDFALARGGVSAAVGLRHLFQSATEINLVPAQGLRVGWHDNGRALAMADAYRSALTEIDTTEQQEMIAGLVTWMDGFPHWAEVAREQHRAVPDLVGFWVS
ncbi:DUF7691 family protein [Microlunatus sp. Y2014]|uniref:DUF7691 family protein n=1 Tax=Microlunatus sp. Y2014 TaxID=3418488 RepID=UPI003DA70E17